MREVILYPGLDNFWVAECQSLPGCISQGETKEIAIINIKEAIKIYIEALEEDNLPVPFNLKNQMSPRVGFYSFRRSLS